MSLRHLTEHCTRPMLVELGSAIKAHEDSLVEPARKVEVEPATAARVTAIVNDEMLGRIELM